MPAQREAGTVTVRWDQILVLALVIVGADLAGTWWLTQGADVGTQAGEEQDAASFAPPDESVLDDDMSRTLRRVALENGLNPTTLAELPELWDQLIEADPEAGSIDTTDRDAVQAALEAHVGNLATGERTGGVSPGGREGGGRPGAGERRGGGGGGGGGGGDMGAATLAPSVERLDEMQYLRLSKLAESHGVDPAQVMPSDELRQAALASGDARSDESIELMDAYRSAFIAIEGPGRPAVGGQ